MKDFGYCAPLKVIKSISLLPCSKNEAARLRRKATQQNSETLRHYRWQPVEDIAVIHLQRDECPRCTCKDIMQ